MHIRGRDYTTTGLIHGYSILCHYVKINLKTYDYIIVQSTLTLHWTRCYQHNLADEQESKNKNFESHYYRSSLLV